MQRRGTKIVLENMEGMILMNDLITVQKYFLSNLVISLSFVECPGSDSARDKLKMIPTALRLSRCSIDLCKECCYTAFSFKQKLSK